MKQRKKWRQMLVIVFLPLFLLCLPSLRAEEKITNFRAKGGDRKIVLSWTNPGDSNFAGTRVIRKEGSYSQNIKDGVQVYDGKNTSYADTNLTWGIYYYYTAFAYDKEGNFSPTGAPSQGSVVAIDYCLVYYGQPKGYSKPASVLMQKVLQVIPAYRKLVASKLSSEEPEYWLLMSEINRDLNQAFEKLKKKFGYDLIGEKGYISLSEEKLPDITKKLIEYLSTDK